VHVARPLAGWGERTATRLAFHVLAQDPSYAKALGQALDQLHERVQRCEQCGNYGAARAATSASTEPRPARAVRGGARADLIAIERTGASAGATTCLHALLAPLEGVGPDSLPVQALIDRIGARASTR
jgi:recombination protein RecR